MVVPLDIAEWNRSGEGRQVVCAHLGSGFITVSEFDKSRLAKRCPAGI